MGFKEISRWKRRALGQKEIKTKMENITSSGALQSTLGLFCENPVASLWVNSGIMAVSFQAECVSAAGGQLCQREWKTTVGQQAGKPSDCSFKQ